MGMGNVSINDPVSSAQSTSSTSTKGGVEKKASKDSISSASAANSFNVLASTKVNNAINLDPPITVGEYTKAVFSASRLSQAQLVIDQLVNSNVFSKFSRGIIDKAMLVGSISQALSALGTEIENLENLQNSQIETLKNAIANTTASMNNNNTESVIDNYEAAVAMYNANPSSPQALSDMNAAIIAYNAAAKKANSSNSSAFTSLNAAISKFNGQQTGNNATINTINSQLTALGIANLPQQDFSESPFSFTLQTGLSTINQGDPAPTIDPSSVTYPTDNLTFITVETSQQFVNANFNNVIQSFNLEDTNGFANTLSTAESINNNRLNKTAGTTTGLPDAYYTPRAYLSPFSVTYAGGGSALVGLTQASTPQSQEAAVYDALHKAFNAIQGVQVPLNTLNHLSYYSAALSRNAALIAGTALLNPEAPTLATESNNTTFGVTFGVINSLSTSQVINSGQVEEGVKQILEQGLAGTDPAVIDKAVAVASAVINQELVKTALAEASNDLKAPGLFGQVLGNSDAATAAGLAQASTTPSTIQATLNDPSNQLFLKSSLSNSLAASSNLSPSAANALVDQVINGVIQQQTTSDNLQKSLSDAFAQTQLSSATQTALAQQAHNIIRTEQNAKQVFSHTLLNEQTTGSIVSGLLLNAGITEANTIADTAIKKVANNISITNDEQYRLDLESALKQQRINETIATQVAQQTVNEASSRNATGLFNPIFVSPTPLATLSEQIHGHVSRALSPVLGSSAANSLADTASATFTGTLAGEPLAASSNRPPSLKEIYQSSQKTLEDNGVNLSPSDSAYRLTPFVKKYEGNLLANTYDPARLLFHSGATTIAGAGIGGDVREGDPGLGKQSTSIRI